MLLHALRSAHISQNMTGYSSAWSDAYPYNALVATPVAVGLSVLVRVAGQGLSQGVLQHDLMHACTLQLWRCACKGRQGDA